MTFAPQKAPLAAVPHLSPNAIENNRRILIVDDEQPVREVFDACLSARYSCVTATSVKEALGHLAREPFAIVLTDVYMPGLSGVELLREVVARYPDTAVIMVSGVDRTQRVLDTLRLGAFDYLVKPCDLDVVEHSVERALERRALLCSARRYKQDLEKQNAELARRKAELERLQAQIVHNEKMASLGQLAAGVAHELNNPAGFIYGNMGILSDYAAGLRRLLQLYDSLPLPADMLAQINFLKEEVGYQESLSDLNSIIDDCRDGAERICDVVQNLRTFSRLDEAEYKKVDLHEGLESTVRLLSSYYTSGAVTLKRDYGQLPPVDCFAGQLNQVWMNLLVNAAQAVRERGEVTITTRLVYETVLVTISDTGCGIAPEHLDKIFDPFFTTKPVGEGTGLGLSITHSVIERHGGFIKVESRLGRGTTFRVSIPVDAMPRRKAAGRVEMDGARLVEV
jgi:two-component system NtrC family sensor kinase